MKLSGRVRDAGNLSRSLQLLAQTRDVDKALRDGAEDIRAEAAETLSDGLPPDSHTGALAASLTVVRGTKPLSYQVFTPLDYGWFLEVGSLKRAPQPWLEPAFERRISALLANLREVFRGLARRAGRRG